MTREIIRRYRLLAFVLILLVVAPSAFAQITDRAEQKKLELRWRTHRAIDHMDDWAELGRYREKNARLAAPAADEKRVVFYGDSITDMWELAKYFSGAPYVNRGISAQTTPEMLVRFRQDVIDLRPSAVVILAGTNDIAGVSGPASLDVIQGNLSSMAELARAHNIKVVFASVLPVHNYTPHAIFMLDGRPPEKILALNRWLVDYCKTNGHTYLDYFTALVDESGLLRREYADDGLHPNEAGYAVMAPLAKAAIDSALTPPPAPAPTVAGPKKSPRKRKNT